MKKYYIAIVLALSVMLFVSFYSQRSAIACMWHSQFKLEQVAGGVYVEPVMVPARVNAIKAMLRRGKARVERTFGIMSSQPKILVVSANSLVGRLTGPHHSTTITSPFGQIIVVDEKHISDDIFAHELVHAEIADRVGYFSHTDTVPAWFEEGVALMVDNREPFRRFNIKVSEDIFEDIQKLQSLEDFAGLDENLNNAQASKLMAAKILQRINRKDLYRRLDKLSDGGDFQQMFSIN